MKTTFKILGVIVIILFVAGLLIKKDPPANSMNYTDAMFITRVEQTPIQFALSFYGVEEAFNNGKSNPIVISFFEDFANWVTDSKTTAWCGAFMSSVFSSTGYEYSNKLSARSWLNIGEVVNDPKVGDVVVFWRGSKNSWQGHVAMFISYSSDKKYINVLGGNQGNAVNVQRYEASRLLGFRRPKYIRVPGNEARYEIPVKLELISE